MPLFKVGDTRGWGWGWSTPAGKLRSLVLLTTRLKNTLHKAVGASVAPMKDKCFADVVHGSPAKAGDAVSVWIQVGQGNARRN